MCSNDQTFLHILAWYNRKMQCVYISTKHTKQNSRSIEEFLIGHMVPEWQLSTENRNRPHGAENIKPVYRSKMWACCT